MSFGKINRSLLNSLLALLLFAVLFTVLMLSSGALHSASRFSNLFSLFLLFSLTGLFVLLLFIGRRLFVALRQMQQKVAGARLTGRLLFMFVSIAVIPSVLVFGFALSFLFRHLDHWFDISVDSAFEKVLELSRTSLSTQSRQAVQFTEQKMAQLASVNDDMLAVKLNELRQESGALELFITESNGRIIAFSNSNRDSFLPDKRMMALNLKHSPSTAYVALESVADGALNIRVVRRYLMLSGIKVNQTRFFHALFRVDEEVARLSRDVEQAYSTFRQLFFLQQPLKINFVLILSFVLSLGILGAVALALIFAQFLVEPVRLLVKGTQALAAGDYSQKVLASELDEFSLLVDSFNLMTAKIKKNHDDAVFNRQVLEQQRAYLEVVLGQLSSGVLSLDCDISLRTFNTAAEEILDLDLPNHVGRNFLRACVEHSALQPLGALLERHLLSNDSDWQEQLVLFTSHGRVILLCRGSHLPDIIPENEHHVPMQLGFVIVFDDITALVKAQRNAAWGEVAQRLAHEIKNPLTPIRLSAERLRHKYLATFAKSDAQTLDRMTTTIIVQVEAMRDMLNAFADYARPPKFTLTLINFNPLIAEVVDLYQSDKVKIITQLANNLPPLNADSGRLRQVLHNLIKNAIEASCEQQRINILLTTSFCQESTRQFIECRIRDKGCGVAQEDLEEVFEPYITHKIKGTGLGLAIVKKIIEEHGGIIWLENNPDVGACVVMRFPQ